MEDSFIKIYRKLLTWEWYHNSNMVHLFIHLLIRANFKDGTWKGVPVKRGQLITGTIKLGSETHISRQTLRTCLTNLKATGEITINSTTKYSIITLCNYDNYQSNQPTKQLNANQTITNNQPTTNQQLTTSEEGNNVKKKENNTEPKNYESIALQFNTFWKEYNKPRGMVSCQHLWSNLSEEDRLNILVHVPKYVINTPDVKYRKNPDNYLTEQLWKDEVTVSTTKHVMVR